MLELARRLTRRRSRPPVGIELLFTVSRGERRCAAPRRSTPAGCAAASATCSTTPRRSARSWSPSPTYHRIVAELRGRAAHAGIRPEDGRSAIVAAARAIAAMRARPPRRRDDRQRRHDRAAARRPTSCPSAAGSRPRCAASTTRASRRSSPRWSTTSRTPPTRPSATSTSTVERHVPAATATKPRAPAGRGSPSGRCARAATSRARSSPAAARTPTRFEAAGLAVRRTWPTAPSATTSPASGSASTRSRGCSRSRSRWSSAGASEVRVGMSDVRAARRARRSARARSSRVGDRALPPRRRRGGHAREGRGTRARSGSSPSTTTHVWLDPPAARGGRRRAPRSRSRPASSTSPGEAPLETAKRELAEEIGKQAGALGASSFGLLHQPRLHRRARLAVPRHRALRRRRAAEAEEDERIEIVPWPLDELDDAIAECEDSKSLIALLWLAPRLGR